jgi:hypothetical protein
VIKVEGDSYQCELQRRSMRDAKIDQKRNAISDRKRNGISTVNRRRAATALFRGSDSKVALKDLKKSVEVRARL